MPLTFNYIYIFFAFEFEFKFVFTAEYSQDLNTKQNIANYRPVAYLNSASKFFERLILDKIGEFEQQTEVDLTEKDQHGFLTCGDSWALSTQ